MVLPALAVAFAVGIALGVELAARGWLLGALVTGAALAGLVGLAAWRRFWALLPVLGAAAAGLCAGAVTLRAPVAPPPSEPVALEGRVERPPERDGHGRTRVLLHCGTARVQVTVAAGAVGLLPGDRARAVVRLHLPEGFANPDGLDARRLARARAIDLVGGVRSADELVRVAGPPQRGPWRAAGSLRARLGALVERAVPAGPARGLLLALTLGDRGEVAPRLDDDFRAAGVTHVLSVSGLHLAVAAFLLYAGLRWLLLWVPALALRLEARRVAAAASIPAVWAYALVTGGAVATCRSAVMATVFFAGIAAARRPFGPAAIAAAAIALLVQAPLALYEPSFQLTFAAILGLALLAPRLAGRGTGLWQRLRRFGAASLAATATTAPIAAYHFHQVAPAGLIGNLLVVPLCELLVLPVGLGALALGCLWPAAAAPFLRVAALGAHAMAAAAHGVARLAPAWQLGTPNLCQIGLYYGTLAACVRARKKLALVLAGGLLASVAVQQVGRLLSTDLVVTFLDVGQGDAAVLELPHGRAVLVDGGGSFEPSFDPGELVIEPFLRRRQVSRLDLVVLTHPHPDHMNGLVRILERFEVGEFWEPGEPAPEAPAYRALRELVAQRGIAHGPPETRTLGGARIDVLGPLGGAHLGRSTNDNSLVLRVRYAGRAILLAGDIERASEAELLGAGADVRADVLKVPHHGSRTSSTPPFVAAVAPALAVFPAGAGNRFGFPHPDVMARYLCPTLITGRDGAVTVRIRRDGSLSYTSVRYHGPGGSMIASGAAW